MVLHNRMRPPPEMLHRLPLPLEIAWVALRIVIGLAGVLLFVLLAEAFFWAIGRLLPLVAPL